MYSAILERLCCPICRKSFTLRADVQEDGDVIEGLLTCVRGHSYRIRQGVADFNSVEQGFANQWEELSEDKSFEDFDRDVDARNPVEIIERRGMVLDAIVEAVSNYEPKVVLDIASGRGLLLTELARTLNDVHIISIDLSTFVLRYDYQKFKKFAPNIKFSFLACDATNLPLKNDAVDAAATYCGFSNMVGCAAEALQEAHRVLKPEGILVDSYVVIEKDSEGYEALHQVCEEQHLDGADAFFLHDGVMKHHVECFSSVACKVVFQGMGIGNGMDLLPYDGEWYAEEVLVSKK